MTEIERFFIIGDIHGCLGMLKSLIDEIDWHPDRDGLIFLGDYIDRGEDSKGVIDFLIDLRESSSNVHGLMGNHEDLFLKYLEAGEEELFLLNGGSSTLMSYSSNGTIRIPENHVSFLKSLKIIFEMDDYYVVHAGFKPGVEIREQSPDDCLWIREPFIYSEYDFGKKIIFGHTPFFSPLLMDNKIGLDTGAVYGNLLTCLEIPSMRFHSVEA
jgi:serine/threonine protein phosphatase 1